jgi:predicted Kef-type K+ transport protein
MAMDFTLVVLILIVLAVLAIFVFKKFRHKILALFLIGLVLFSYFGFSTITSKNEVDLNNLPGIWEAGKLYVSWLVSIFGNFRQITANAIEMDWFNKNKIEEVNDGLFDLNNLNLTKQKS